MARADDRTMAYGGGSASAEQVTAALDALWSELREPGMLRRDAAAAGVDGAALAELVAHPRAEVFTVTKGGEGLDPITTAILVKVVIPLAGAVAVDLWKKVLLPRIERKLGRELPPADAR